MKFRTDETNFDKQDGNLNFGRIGAWNKIKECNITWIDGLTREKNEQRKLWRR